MADKIDQTACALGQLAVQELNAALGHFYLRFAIRVPPHSVRTAGGVNTDVFDIAQIIKSELRMAAAESAFFQAAPGQLWCGV